jgi:U3 small nucleolar RNA-associated protein 3
MLSSHASSSSPNHSPHTPCTPQPPRLVQLRSYLERVRPIDKQLAYQLDKLLRATALARTQDPEAAGGSGGAAAAADELAARPNPAALVAKAPLVAPADGEGGAGGVYRPPKLNPVAMEGDAELSRQERRRLKEAARKAQRRWVCWQLGGCGPGAGCGGVCCCAAG